MQCATREELNRGTTPRTTTSLQQASNSHRKPTRHAMERRTNTSYTWHPTHNIDHTQAWVHQANRWRCAHMRLFTRARRLLRRETVFVNERYSLLYQIQASLMLALFCTVAGAVITTVGGMGLLCRGSNHRCTAPRPTVPSHNKSRATVSPKAALRYTQMH